MKLSYHFPTVIGSYNDEKFVDHIYPFIKNILDNDNSLYWNYKTTFPNDDINLLLAQNKDIQEYILNLANKFANEMNLRLSKDIMICPFVTRMMKGDNHNKHNHPNAILSGLIYLNVPEGSSPVVFHDTNNIRVYNRLFPTKETFQNRDRISYMPKKGDVLIWESFIDHEVPLNEADNRETLVFNITYKTNHSS
tara:strand:+ start:268 stop:849 length:582 start_codon:yes stop_codon:yes gene_type:complete